VRCAACGGAELRPGLRVAGHLGKDGLIPTTDQFGVALGDFLRCVACGHLQLAAMPELASLYEEAASDDYEAEEEGQRITARRDLGRLEHHAPARGRLLDLGCWVGFLASEASARGWEVVGVEPSRWAAERARARGVEVVDEPSGRFDALVLGDVIEHLPEPGTALRHVAPGGLVWIATPDAGSRLARVLGRRWWSVIPTHLHLFTRRSLRALLERHGFEVLAIGSSPKTFTVGYYLERLGGYWPPLARALVAAAGALGVAERQWTPDFRDRFYVVASRAGARGPAGDAR
jgi:SAM-dependent methyltransferase